MDCSRLLGVLCLLPLLLCGCGDPGLKLRRAAFDGDVATVEKILKAHPELIDDRGKAVPAPPPVATTPPPAPIAWLNKFFNGRDDEFYLWNNSDVSPLDLAVVKEREVVVKLLLAQKADANATNKYGRTSLFYAAYNRTSTNAALLLAAKAEPNVTSLRGETPLLAAACSGNDGAVKLLLEHGAQVNVFNAHGWTPLHGAAWCNHIKSVRLLLTKIPVNTPDARGNTALHYAMEHGSEDMCVLLLASGAELNAANHEGVTPLFHTIKNSFPLPRRLETGRHEHHPAPPPARREGIGTPHSFLKRI